MKYIQICYLSSDTDFLPYIIKISPNYSNLIVVNDWIYYDTIKYRYLTKCAYWQGPAIPCFCVTQFLRFWFLLGTNPGSCGFWWVILIFPAFCNAVVFQIAVWPCTPGLPSRGSCNRTQTHLEHWRKCTSIDLIKLH